MKTTKSKKFLNGNYDDSFLKLLNELPVILEYVASHIKSKNRDFKRSEYQSRKISANKEYKQFLKAFKREVKLEYLLNKNKIELQLRSAGISASTVEYLINKITRLWQNLKRNFSKRSATHLLLLINMLLVLLMYSLKEYQDQLETFKDFKDLILQWLENI